MNHYVYFIRQDGKGNQPMKVGYSNNPDARLKSLQTGNPNKLYLSASIPCENESDARKFERTMHWLLTKKYRKLTGEWFLVYGQIPKLIIAAQKMCRKDETVKIEKTEYFSKDKDREIKRLRKIILIKDEEIDLLQDELESIDRNYL